jgi:hypothetical protein
LHFTYEARDVSLGLAISALSWIVWGLMLAVVAVGRKKRRKP